MDSVREPMILGSHPLLLKDSLPFHCMYSDLRKNRTGDRHTCFHVLLADDIHGRSTHL